MEQQQREQQQPSEREQAPKKVCSMRRLPSPPCLLPTNPLLSPLLPSPPLPALPHPTLAQLGSRTCVGLLQSSQLEALAQRQLEALAQRQQEGEDFADRCTQLLGDYWPVLEVRGTRGGAGIVAGGLS